MMVSRGVKYIVAHTGERIIVSEEDYDLLSKIKWWISSGYAMSWSNLDKMHRVVLKCNSGEIVDHINRDKLDNRRENLRIVSREENVHNQKKRTGTKNNYKGTNFVKKLGLWQSRCRIYKNDFFLGYYLSEEAAAYAYNKKASELSNTILLNELNFTIKELEKMLIKDRIHQKKAEKVSAHKGVYWHKKEGRMKRGKWTPIIRVNGKMKSLGRFDEEIDAINAHKAAVEKYINRNKLN